MAKEINSTERFLDYSDGIPITAKAIKVTNIQSLYLMKAYKIKKYKEKLDSIYRQLLKFTSSNDFSQKEVVEAKVGDVVLVQSSNHKNSVELPSYLCRGLITYITRDGTKYNVHLVDHGISIALTSHEFHVVPENFISEKYLTKTIGMYNILPIRMRKNSADCNSMAVVVEEWSEEAIEFAKDLLIASRTVYFDRLFTDEKDGREYGKIYLTIDNIVISLNEALVINYYATYLEGELLHLIENPSRTKYKENTEEEIIINVKFSTNNQKNAIRPAEKITKFYDSIKNSEKVFIQSTVNCGVLSDINDLGFPEEIHQGWNEYIKSSRPRKLQAYIWPPIKKGLNVVAIGPSQCGKTTGCTMAVCGLVAARENELSRSATHPLALILCSSSFEVINIHTMCMVFLQTSNKVRCVAAFNGKTYRSVAAMIYSGCQILVTTPRYLVRFLNENKNLLSFDELSYLVLDNADLILSKYYESVGELFKKHKIIDNREPRGDNRPILQIIMSATNWTSQIKKFVSLVMYNPYICIASFIEATIFKSVHSVIHVLKSACKNQKILDILKDDYTKLRTMIICTNTEEAEKLNTFLLPTKTTLLIHEKMKSFDIQALQEIWKTHVYNFYPVLICTDAVLSQLNFTNIQWLIHHSVLLKFKNQFNYRFSVLLDNLIQDAAKCKVNIIIDEHNNVQFVSIMTMMQRMNVVIPPDLLKNIERIRITLERDKKNYHICDNIKSLGVCSDKNICVFRHCILPEIDTPMTDVQINDKVKLMVMYVHDATHFSARLIEHIPQSKDSKKITFSNVEYMQVTLKIQEYYRNVENRKVCMSTNVGDICVLEESLDIFKRIQIKRVRYDRGNTEDTKFVDVRCIDSGVTHECVDVRKLIHIPEELINLPTHIVEIYLTGLTPCDEEYIWNSCANETVHKWFSESFDERSYIIGKVHLHLGNTIWLDDLKVGTKLINHSDLIRSSLRKRLIDEGHAVPNDDHVSHLFNLCKKSGLSQINGYDIA